MNCWSSFKISYIIYPFRSLSASYELENGLPQGSVLSVTLFLCAINSILDSVSLPVKELLYADDLTIFISHKNIRHIEKKLQLTINKLNKWSEENGFTFSEQKTKGMLFTRTYKDYLPPRLFPNQSQIEIVDSVKFLVLHFDTHLNWKMHITALVKSFKSCVSNKNGEQTKKPSSIFINP